LGAIELSGALRVELATRERESGQCGPSEAAALCRSWSIFPSLRGLGVRAGAVEKFAVRLRAGGMEFRPLEQSSWLERTSRGAEEPAWRLRSHSSGAADEHWGLAGTCCARVGLAGTSQARADGWTRGGR